MFDVQDNPTAERIQWLALATGLLPIIAVHATYFVSAAQGHVPWCFPYLDSCTSISATGRHGVAYFLFKGTIIPEAVLLVFYWYVTGRWLAALGDRPLARNAIVALGVTGAVFLVIYAVALGAVGDWLQLQRRIGITAFFGATYIAQFLLVWRIGLLRPQEPTYGWLYGLCVTILLIGFVSLLMGIFMANYDDYEDAFEWVLALLIHSYFLVSFVTWRNTGLVLRVDLREG